MAANFRFSIDPDAEAATGAALLDFLKEIDEDIAVTARRLVPVLSGDLMRSIEHEEELDGAVAVGRVGSNLDYALAVEKGIEGRPGYPIQPYLAPAIYQVRGR